MLPARWPAHLLRRVALYGWLRHSLPWASLLLLRLPLSHALRLQKRRLRAARLLQRGLAGRLCSVLWCLARAGLLTIRDAVSAVLCRSEGDQSHYDSSPGPSPCHEGSATNIMRHWPICAHARDVTSCPYRIILWGFQKRAWWLPLS